MVPILGNSAKNLTRLGIMSCLATWTHAQLFLYIWMKKRGSAEAVFLGCVLARYLV